MEAMRTCGSYLCRACYNKGHYYLGLAETQKQVGKWEIFTVEKGKALNTLWLERRENREVGSRWPSPDYSELVAIEVVTHESYCHLVWPLSLRILSLTGILELGDQRPFYLSDTLQIPQISETSENTLEWKENIGCKA